jgi:SAM-dependent methyltransferase
MSHPVKADAHSLHRRIDMGVETEVLEVSEKRWSDAQHFESDVWIRSNQQNSGWKVLERFVRATRHPTRLVKYLAYRDFHCGDDWNYWWLEQFENYRVLPKSVEKVGCGPYTNIRLISQRCRIQEIHCCDPLIDLYTTFRLTWLAEQVSKNRVKVSKQKAEFLTFKDGCFDMAVCINVLDHVQNANECLRQLLRVVKSGGFIIFGQDLSSEDDCKIEMVNKDVGHPIKIHHTSLNAVFDSACQTRLKKILPREKGRNPIAHYGTYIFIGQKK